MKCGRGLRYRVLSAVFLKLPVVCSKCVIPAVNSRWARLVFFGSRAFRSMVEPVFLVSARSRPAIEQRPFFSCMFSLRVIVIKSCIFTCAYRMRFYALGGLEARAGQAFRLSCAKESSSDSGCSMLKAIVSPTFRQRLDSLRGGLGAAYKVHSEGSICTANRLLSLQFTDASDASLLGKVMERRRAASNWFESRLPVINNTQTFSTLTLLENSYRGTQRRSPSP